jgi:hypothetical protein
MSTGLKVFDGILAHQGFKVRDSGFIEVHADVPTETLVLAIHDFKRLGEDTQKLHKLTSIAIGSLVLEHAARHKCSLSESVDVLDICRDFDVAKKTALKWAKIVSVIPEPVLSLPNLHIGHLDAACSFAMPTEPDAMRKFAKERDGMLQDINEDPHDKGKRYVEDKMRSMKTKYGVDSKRQEPIQRIFKKLVWAYRILRLNREVRARKLAEVGMTDPDLFAYIRSWEDELVIRKQIPDDVVAAPITWHSGSKED